jgi:hypothetical protein
LPHQHTDSPVRLLIVGENIAGDRVAYPIDPGQRRPDDDWTDAPAARWDLITAVPAPRAIGPQE